MATGYPKGGGAAGVGHLSPPPAAPHRTCPPVYGLPVYRVPAAAAPPCGEECWKERR